MKKNLMSLFLVLAFVASNAFAASLTVNVETLLKASTDASSATLLVLKPGEKADILQEIGEYSLVTVKSGSVKLAANGKSANEGWIWDSLVQWTGNEGVVKEDAALSQGPYLAGHDVLIGAVKQGGTITRTKVDAWWYRVKIRGVEGLVFRTAVTVTP